MEAIDASKTELMWEGFDNMVRSDFWQFNLFISSFPYLQVDLQHLKLLRLADCPYIDDWCMSKLPQFSKSLELLDLSGCSKISANGLSALGSMKFVFLKVKFSFSITFRQLKHLRLNNVGQSNVRATKETGKVRLINRFPLINQSISGCTHAGRMHSFARSERRRL